MNKPDTIVIDAVPLEPIQATDISIIIDTLDGVLRDVLGDFGYWVFSVATS